MACATILACFGIKAAFDSHSLAEPPIPHSYSLHSWAGILTISMAVAQWCFGLVTFLWPGLASHLRSFFLPIHIFFGLTIFILASTTALLGITEKAFFKLQGEYKVHIAIEFRFMNDFVII